MNGDIAPPDPSTASNAGHCDRHGPFERIYLSSLNRWTGSCEQCGKDQRAAEHEEARQRRHAEQLEAYKARVLVPKRFGGKGFDTYKPRTPGQQAALKACTAFAADAAANVEAGRCMVLLGPAGVGKTHLLNSTLTAIAGQMIGARYATAAGFLAAVRGNWAWHGAEAEIQNEYLDFPVLALDELWLPAHERDKEAVFALVDERYRARLPTLIGSNLTWAMMREAFGERLCDRLLENGGIVLIVDGESMRPAP